MSTNTKPWLGMNLNRQDYFEPGRFDANWAKAGQFWRRANGDPAAIGPEGLPTERSSSILKIGNHAIPDGEWALKWLPQSTAVTLDGSGVLPGDPIPNGRKYHVDQYAQLRINTNGPLDAVGLFPPGIDQSMTFWPDAFLPLFKLGLETFRLLDFNNINRVGAKTHDGWLPDWSKRPLETDGRWLFGALPWELQIKVAKALRAKRIQIQIPHLADEAYVRGLARLLAERWDGGVDVEPSNEAWNQGTPQGIFYKNNPSHAGRDALRFFTWWLQEFPRDRTRFMIMGQQADGGRWARKVAAEVGADLVDLIGCAGYCPPLPQTEQEWERRARINPLDIPSVEDVAAACWATLHNVLPGHFEAHKALADVFDAEFALYEFAIGGINGNRPFGLPYIQYDESYDAGELTLALCHLVAGYDPAVASYYAYMAGASAQHGCWGSWRDFLTPLPKWDALRDFAAGTR